MSEYTPTTEHVRSAWEEHNIPEDFDRWLALVKADAWEEGWNEGCEYGWSGTGARLEGNPYRGESE